jgi:alkanesulfonate monooxygenase SsuD/methylene tetrahydromethanopterin reductase-like flavin-dependent oxidoreductase (luciferase family)
LCGDVDGPERLSRLPGTPDTVAAKIIDTALALDLSRFNMKYSNGTLPHDTLMRSIELFGTKVAPRVREQLGGAVRVSPSLTTS